MTPLETVRLWLPVALSLASPLVGFVAAQPAQSTRPAELLSPAEFPDYDANVWREQRDGLATKSGSRRLTQQPGSPEITELLRQNRVDDALRVRASSWTSTRRTSRAHLKSSPSNRRCFRITRAAIQRPSRSSSTPRGNSWRACHERQAVLTAIVAKLGRTPEPDQPAKIDILGFWNRFFPGERQSGAISENVLWILFETYPIITELDSSMPSGRRQRPVSGLDTREGRLSWKSVKESGQPRRSSTGGLRKFRSARRSCLDRLSCSWKPA